MSEILQWNCCPICRSADVVFSDGIGECRNCTHKFRHYIPAEILPRYYEKQYWNNDKNRQGITSVKFSDEWTRWVGARIRLLESFDLISHEDPSKISVLEFGCAEGMVLYALKQRGYNVMGNDICAIVNEGHTELGIEISRKPIEQFTEENRKFDLIMSFHVVEHLRDPYEIMKKLCSMLNDGGKMLLHVPVDDQELGNTDHFHFFTNKSCLYLMNCFTDNIKSDFVYYPITKGGAAMAATYVGTKK